MLGVSRCECPVCAALITAECGESQARLQVVCTQAVVRIGNGYACITASTELKQCQLVLQTIHWYDAPVHQLVRCALAVAGRVPALACWVPLASALDARVFAV